jgi:hypothetical protein
MNNLQKEASQYDLASLVRLQEKRKENIAIFERSINNERAASEQEEVAQLSLEKKLKFHDLSLVILDGTEKELILTDIPKLKSTREKREHTIMLLKSAILEEYAMMDKEEQMIRFLETRDGSKK